MNNPGIDYGLGTSNTDHKTGIRYGVINQSEVLQAWCDESEPYYGEPTCGHCGNELSSRRKARLENGLVTWCGFCHARIEDISDAFPEDSIANEYDGGGYICHQSADDTDIFIIKSPYFTCCQFCSPCAPGAGYLMNPFVLSPEMPLDATLPDKGYACHAVASGFPRAYCFGHDWYESGKAPYPVFSVETGELINP